MKTELTFLGHATVALQHEQFHVIIDPWLEGNPMCPASLAEPAACDLIILTHGHDDHAASAVALAKRTGATVCATFELAELLRRDGVPAEQLQHMNKGGTVSLPGGVSVSLTNAYHSSSYTMSDGTVCYAGEACGTVVTFQNGTTIYHAGDTCFFEDMQYIGEHFKPDLACLPIGDRFTMGPIQAARAANAIGAPRVLPIHFGTFEALSGTVAAFKESLSGSEVSCEDCEPGQTITI